MKCHARYVGQTCKKRMNSNRFDICHYPDNFTNDSVHLNEKRLYSKMTFHLPQLMKLELNGEGY